MGLGLSSPKGKCCGREGTVFYVGDWNGYELSAEGWFVIVNSHIVTKVRHSKCLWWRGYSSANKTRWGLVSLSVPSYILQTIDY